MLRPRDGAVVGLRDLAGVPPPKRSSVYQPDIFAPAVRQHGADCAGEEAGEVEDAGVVEGEHGWSVAWVVGAWQETGGVAIMFGVTGK